jgi:hypothetical protein
MYAKNHYSMIKCEMCWKDIERRWARRMCVKCSNKLHKKRYKEYLVNKKRCETETT